MTINIIHMTTYLQGGAGKIICDLIEQQVRNGFNVVCISNSTEHPGYSTYPEYNKRLKGLGVKHIRVEGLFKRDLCLQGLAVEQVVESFSTLTVDVVHTHSAMPSCVALQVRLQLHGEFPIISTMHGWGKNKTSDQERQDISTLGKLDKVVPVSASAFDFLEGKGIPRSVLSLIYNGIANENRCTLDAELVRRLRQDKLESIFTISCIGSVCERKNQSLLVEAIRRLKLDGIKLACYFFGETCETYAKELIKNVDDLGLSTNIHFLGCVPNADKYLPYLDLMILPSQAEGLPISILEAFRENTLVLSSDIKPCKELITEGLSGYLFANGSVESLCLKIENIRELNQVKAQEIKLKAYSDYLDRFSLEQMYQAYCELYKEVMTQ